MLAKELMDPNVISIRKETPVQEIANLMLKHDISGFPVVDRLGNVLGVVSELDLMHKEIKDHLRAIGMTEIAHHHGFCTSTVHISKQHEYP